VVLPCNPSTQEADATGSEVGGHSGLHRKTLFHKIKATPKTKNTA
jgi:hypothetical protein